MEETKFREILMIGSGSEYVKFRYIFIRPLYLHVAFLAKWLFELLCVHSCVRENSWCTKARRVTRNRVARKRKTESAMHALLSRNTLLYIYFFFFIIRTWFFFIARVPCYNSVFILFLRLKQLASSVKRLDKTTHPVIECNKDLKLYIGKWILYIIQK